MVHNGGAIEELLKDKITTLEFFDFFLGEHLGEGCSRDVFEYAFDKKYVLKIEKGEFNANVAEFNVWQSVQYTKLSKWFAPIKLMSRCGRVLMQRRCNYNYNKPLKFPKKLPVFFTDIKASNFGMMDGRLVCFDYASNLLMEKGMSSKTKKVIFN